MTPTYLDDETDRLHVPHRFAVLGSPIAHSRSPLLHRTAYSVLGLPWQYEAVEVDSDALAGFVERLTPPWRGLSLTMPLKETIIPLLDSVDAVATTAGGVNTVLVTFDDGRRRLEGFNTDVYGIRECLVRGGIPAVKSAMVVGGGATARSTVVALAQLGAEHVDIVLRSPDKAASVVESARAAGLSRTVVALHDRDAVAALEPDLTVSTLPGGAGVSARFTGTPALRAPLLDVAYHPWPSELGVLWGAAGSTVIPGLTMLVHQAVAQLRIFVHGDPLVKIDGEDRMTAALLEAVAS
ncbi:shikimate dehydrogenase [Herbiconiux sp. KACC 21604]|uniref:shikimate dehydrogenase n=1 Tax=unclassified Herbiconiux TaxID=2618217 RepID=UPI0014926955|nr:shikimate dehydrogenase [Herbiconiux sp. SALV-R1]QJU53615.1 shikimate dehydrogenase [Herbiconiux sp. SALV-R1]WPO88599.1 shikimate dehydrogenase [Herbiconiux sp. KACC 21604]